jgi:glucosamine--fructose-6-phosphate aminotransferase (isomerizing)
VGLIDEINEQPAVVDRLLVALPDLLRPIVDDVRARGIDHVLVAARGSSDHAGVYGVYALGAVAGMPVALAAPSLFSRYGQPPRVGGALVIGISQSGRSPDVVAVLAEASRQGALTMAVTNDPESPLAEAAAHVTDLGAGPERSVAATKTYTAQLAVMAALAASLGERPTDAWADLRRVPGVMGRALASADAARALARDARDMVECVVVGRGFSLATALEWALKLKELAGIRAQAYSAADYEHGPVASFGSGGWLLAVRASGPMAGDIEALASRLVAERAGHALLLSGRAASDAAWLPFPDELPEWLSPLVAILPAQLFAAALTAEKGMDAERPRGLSKVTLTR